MAVNDPTLLRAEANRCRETALDYLRRAEGPFLINIARAFDDLAAKADRARPIPHRPTL